MPKGRTTASGRPDMRCSANRTAAGLPTGPGSRSSTSSSSGSGPTAASGRPDMRYSANRTTAGLPTGPGSRSSNSGGRPSGRTTSSGNLDMRVAANRAELGLPTGPGSRSSTSSNSGRPSGRTTASGNLDKRVAANRAELGLPTGPGSRSGGGTAPAPVRSSIPLTKKGLPDKRYKVVRDRLESEKFNGIPDYVKTKHDGTPDMRTKEAKAWIEKESQASAARNEIPDWVPRTKSGALKDSALTRAYLKAVDDSPSINDFPMDCEKYYDEIQQSPDYVECFERFERQDIPVGGPYELSFIPPEACLEQDPDKDMPDWYSKIPTTIRAFSSDDLILDSEKEIGRGSFGVVYHATLYGIGDVAVKRLSLSVLRNSEKKAFITELNVLSQLGDHTNIIKLYGYTLSPPCVIMELAKKNSLYHLIYEDDTIENIAAINHDKYRMKIAFGVANALAQLAKCGIVHGDVKPQNVLLTDDFTPKLSDFGLARLKSRIKSSTSSQATEAESETSCIGGTYAYLAPELLDFNYEANEKTDVYSYGILINELMVGNYPYAEQFRKFTSRPADAVAHYAKLGNRPKKNPKAPEKFNALIEQCWDANPTKRPSFVEIMDLLN